MERKFIIFVVFASLAQCSFALPLDLTYNGLSGGELAHLTRILFYQNETLRTKFDAANPIFDTIEKHLYVHISGLGAVNDGDFSRIDEARSRAKDAIDYQLNGVQMITGRSCLALKRTRKEIYADNDGFYASVTNALELALTGDYSANRVRIEVHQSRARKAVRDAVQKIYNLILTCLNNDDRDAVAVVRRFKNGSGLSLDHSVDAIFSAIKVYAAKDTGKIGSESLISANGDLRNQALINLRTDVVNKFSVIRTFYLYSKLNKTGILPALAAIQNAEIVSLYKFQAATNGVFDTIIGFLTKLALGIYDGGDDDFSRTDAAEATAIAQYNAVAELFLESAILSSQHNDTKAVAATREALSTATTGIIGAFFDAIRVAQATRGNYSETLAKIAVFKKSQISSDTIYVQSTLNSIRTGESLDADSEAHLAGIQKAAIDLVPAVGDNIFVPFEILARASDMDKASENDFSAIRTMQAIALAGFVDYTQVISAAEVIVLMARKSN